MSPKTFLSNDHDFITDVGVLWFRHKWTIIFLSCLIFIALIYFVNKVLPDIQKKLQIVDQSTLTSLKPKPIKKKYETRCRQILEKIFNKSFPCVRPAWLKNPKTGRNLELDCFCASLNLALEFQGAQHADFSYHFHRTQAAFEYQQWRDEYKRQKCAEMGVKLITVPHTVEFKDLEAYIVEELIKLNVSS